MKTRIRFVGVIAVGISLLVASSVLARDGFGGGHGGSSGGYHGGSGWHGGWGISLAYGWPAYYPPYYYYDSYAPAYYYAPAPVVYSTQPQVVYSSPTVNYEPQRPAQPPAPTGQNQSAQSPAPMQSMTVADIKALAKGGLSDEVILSQIRSNHAVFKLTTEEILDLNTNKVSQKVIEFMINTASAHHD